MRAAVFAGAALLSLTPALASETISYTYDARGRLVKVAHSGTVNAGATACYAYDKADNRSNVTVATSSDCSDSAGAVSFSVNDVSVTEGGNLVFTVTKSGTASGSLTVNYATANGTASASDYTAKSGTLTFTAAQTSQTVSVVTTNDTTVESAETVLLNLSNASTGATISDSQGVGTINDNDSAATCSGVSFSVSSNAAVAEGTNSVFTITKTGSTSSSCSVNYATANNVAIAGSDYTAKSGTLTFTAAQTSQTVSVVTTDDTATEAAETFKMQLSLPTGGATLGTASVLATINDNDTAAGPSFSIDDTSITEGGDLTFTVYKAGSTSSSLSVNYATANGTAVSLSDYTAKSGTLTFAPTDTFKTVLVTTKTDILLEDEESMVVNLSSPSPGSTISDSQGIGTILDGDTGGGCPSAVQGDAGAETSTDSAQSNSGGSQILSTPVCP